MRQFTLLLLLATSSALAQQTDELDALRLADSAAKPVVAASDWQGFVEGAFGQSLPRTGGPGINSQRLSFDFEFDQTFAPGWRALLTDRLDLNWQDQPQQRRDVNTLKEAYLSWQFNENRLFDLGRINAFQGVAIGYNPTDFFRSGAVRSAVSVDPASLKKNRMGSVMLRGQQFWESGSVTALFSPKLAQQTDPASASSSFSPDLGVTNHQDRWLFALSQKISEGITPQWLIYGKAQQAPQFGFNLTALANDASVVYLEWSGGRSRSLLSQALSANDDTAFRQRLATGMTYTSSAKLSLTVEYEYNGAALGQSGWDKLRQGSPLAYGRYRAWQQTAQELPTKEELFFHMNWQDAGLIHLDLSAMQKFNRADHSRLSWLEARYRLDKTELALQWQSHSGNASSAYGASSQRRAWQALLRYYF